MGAEAILSVLFGDYNPTAKLPYTVYPASFIKRDLFNFDLQGDGGLTYKYYKGKYGKAVYKFGFGLSYTTFDYQIDGDVATSAVADLKRENGQGKSCYDCSKLEFKVRVTNTGNVAGGTPVLGFVANRGSNATKELFDFGRVDLLAPGASATVTLAFDGGCKQSISMVDAQGKRWILPGDYTLEVGDVNMPVTAKLKVTGSPAQIDPSCAIS